MADIFASLIKLPTFKDNYIMDGIVASYDRETGAIQVKKTDLVEDADPENNVFRKVFKKLPEHQKILEDCFDKEKYAINDFNDSELKVVDMSWEEYEKEFLTARKMDYDKCDNESFHVIHTKYKNEDLKEEKNGGNVFSFEEKDTKYKDFVYLQQKMELLKHDTMPIVTIQFLFVLIQNLKCSSVAILSHMEMCTELSNNFENVDENEYDGKNKEKQKTFKLFPNLFDKNGKKKSIELFKKYVKEGDRIIMDTQQGDWYVLRTVKNTIDVDDKDEVDGEITDVLLQIGSNLLTTLVMLVSKHVKKYIKKQKGMKNKN